MRKRNLSEFMCIEMLYDYKSEKLDPLRTQAVEEGLESSAKVREEFNKLSVGLSYCEKLNNVTVSDALVNLIFEHPKTSEKIISRIRWQNLPQAVRWTVEAVVVAVAVALFVTQVPNLFKDEKIEPNTMLVKKFDIKPPEEQVTTTEPTKVSEVYKAPEQVPMDLAPVDGTTPQKVAEKTPETKPEVIEKKPVIVASKEIPVLLRPPQKTTVAQPTVVASTPVVTPSPAPAKIAAAVVETPVKTPVEASETKVAEAKPVESPEPGTTETTETAETKAVAPAKKGNAYLYRMTMYVDDVDTVTPEIVNLISSMGGQKAGEVELGWRRKGGSYFHFSVPEANSPKMQEGLKKYAPFNIVKSAHPRVMPEGIERYILWVEKKATKEESPDDSDKTQSAGTVTPEENTQGTSQENNEAN
jgi:hypothetical protein